MLSVPWKWPLAAVMVQVGLLYVRHDRNTAITATSVAATGVLA